MTKREALQQIDELIAILSKYRSSINQVPDSPDVTIVETRQKAMLKEAARALGSAGTVCPTCSGSGRLS